MSDREVELSGSCRATAVLPFTGARLPKANRQGARL